MKDIKPRNATYHIDRNLASKSPETATDPLTPWMPKIKSRETSIEPIPPGRKLIIPTSVANAINPANSRGWIVIPTDLKAK